MREELSAYGLSEKETGVYLAALKSGSCTANRLSELTGIRRSTVYEVTESLKKKGLITSHKKDRKFFFAASPPEGLINRLKEKEEIIERIMPELRRMARALPERPEVMLYEGRVGIKTAVEEMLESREILLYGAAKTGDEIFGWYTASFARKRAKRGIILRAVTGPDVPEHMTEKGMRGCTPIRVIDSFKNHNSAYFIYNNKVLILTLGEELTAIRITSPLLVESQKRVFKLLWSSAKEIPATESAN